MSSLLGKIQTSSLLEIFTGGEGGGVRIRTEHFFYREGGEDFFRSEHFFTGRGGRRFFSDRAFFFTGRGGEEGGPGKKTRSQRSFFSPFPAGFTVPTATSRLGQPTNGGNAGRVGSGKKSPFDAWSFFWGEGWGRVKKGEK